MQLLYFGFFFIKYQMITNKFAEWFFNITIKKTKLIMIKKYLRTYLNKH